MKKKNNNLTLIRTMAQNGVKAPLVTVLYTVCMDTLHAISMDSSDVQTVGLDIKNGHSGETEVTISQLKMAFSKERLFKPILD